MLHKVQEGTTESGHELLCHFSIRILLSVLALKDGFSVFVQLQRGDNNVAWMDANGGRRAVDLVTVHSVDVDDPFFTVDLGDLSITTLVFSPHNQDLVVLSYWDRANVIFGSQVL